MLRAFYFALLLLIKIITIIIKIVTITFVFLSIFLPTYYNICALDKQGNLDSVVDLFINWSTFNS